MSASAAVDTERPTPSGVLAALYRAVEPTDPVETARALVADHSVRIALCLDCPDELEAVGRALGICLRMLGRSPELGGYGIADCRLL
ncbi:hypothetical protein [Streptomyces sp. NPDC002057]|uniref:hypothetical protein n=1 Tax=Streptomyces sp. NPDC002057 TaxID=3154664 RepID=UPI00332A526C